MLITEHAYQSNNNQTKLCLFNQVSSLVTTQQMSDNLDAKQSCLVC